MPVLGIEPAANVARAAEARGVPTRVDFLGEATGRAIAAEFGAADLVLGNNVLVHLYYGGRVEDAHLAHLARPQAATPEHPFLEAGKNTLE